MKIEGPSRTQQTSKSGKTGKTGKTEASFGEYVAAGTAKTAAAAPSRSIAQVDALLAVQGAEDPTERAARKRMYVRADDLLNGLDNIRMALLSGTLTLGHCLDIADVVASHREKITDPSLTSLLDEIDLRAQVEIAKMRKSLNASPSV
ncbi:MAG: flagellar assembly protein FliX [Rhodospirillales bacterium]|nr:flagellar assembly protein FliX [Alphaproteobacteria bacterium]USO02957.1 MAG: flagellar assembly protein FliX [Rhodospirillales bacterium]